jgi:hypothetical protein
MINELNYESSKRSSKMSRMGYGTIFCRTLDLYSGESAISSLGCAGMYLLFNFT